MTKLIRTTCALFSGVLLMSAALPGTAFAVDGQIAITQAKAMAGGVTPGDTPGFPISLTQPGSYVLSSNLTVPDANTNAIELTASHVTVDLNGFAILGPTDCSGGTDPCAGAGGGSGISSLGVVFNVTVRNGTVQGMGNFGVSLHGDSHLVEYVHARSNGNSGIFIMPSNDDGLSIVQYSTAQRNGNTGIGVARGMVRNSTADTNGTFGIFVGVGSAANNVVVRSKVGLLLSVESSYIANVMNGNITNVQEGVNQGQNLCNASPCPNAQF